MRGTNIIVCFDLIWNKGSSTKRHAEPTIRGISVTVPCGLGNFNRIVIAGEIKNNSITQIDGDGGWTKVKA